MGFVQIPCVTLEISSGVQPLRGFSLSISTGRLFLFPIFSNLYSLYPFHSYFNCRSDTVTLMDSTLKRNTIFSSNRPALLSFPAVDRGISPITSVDARPSATNKPARYSTVDRCPDRSRPPDNARSTTLWYLQSSLQDDVAQTSYKASPVHIRTSDPDDSSNLKGGFLV